MRPSEQQRNVPWSQQRRLRFIEFRLQWRGSINRADVQVQFNISIPQASADLKEYARIAPTNMEYDGRLKAYVATPAFHPVFDSSGGPQYLTQLFAVQAGILSAEDSPFDFVPPTALVPLPNRATQSSTLRAVVSAIRDGRSLDIDYQSIAREEQRRRLITPRGFGQDGLRWHTRAYCHLRGGFYDFVLGRILQVHGVVTTPPGLPQDDQWSRMITVILAPHPKLAPSLQEGIKIDFNMVDGEAHVECRQAMLFYLFKSLGLSPSGEPLPDVKQVVVKNLPDIKHFLPKPGQP